MSFRGIVGDLGGQMIGLDGATNEGVEMGKKPTAPKEEYE
jgi:hypothetical protein